MRKALSIILWLLVALFAYITLTVPMIAAAAPAIITVALAVAAFLMWPKRRNKQIAA